MKNLIDKDILENILRGLWKEDDGKNSEHRICYNKALQDVQCEIDSLDVKEVDLEKEFDDYTKNILACDVQFEPFTHLYNCAKYFFELGLKVAQKGEYVWQKN